MIEDLKKKISELFDPESLCAATDVSFMTTHFCTSKSLVCTAGSAAVSGIFND